MVALHAELSELYNSDTGLTGQYYGDTDMQELAYRTSRILRVLGNPLRYRILDRLARGPATPKELSVELSRPLYTISHHLAFLRALDLVWYHPSPPRLIYETKYEIVRPFLRAAERCAVTARADDPGPAPKR